MITQFFAANFCVFYMFVLYFHLITGTFLPGCIRRQKKHALSTPKIEKSIRVSLHCPNDSKMEEHSDLANDLMKSTTAREFSNLEVTAKSGSSPPPSVYFVHETSRDTTIKKGVKSLKPLHLQAGTSSEQQKHTTSAKIVSVKPTSAINSSVHKTVQDTTAQVYNKSSIPSDTITTTKTDTATNTTSENVPKSAAFTKKKKIGTVEPMSKLIATTPLLTMESNTISHLLSSSRKKRQLDKSLASKESRVNGTAIDETISSKLLKPNSSYC